MGTHKIVLEKWVENGCFEVDYTVPVTFNSINALIREFREAIEYQKCVELKININSPGGEYLALQHYLWHLKKWRRSGVVLKTEAQVSVASAAAVMLTLGDIGQRYAYPHTELVFHYARLQNVQTLTADKSSFLKQNLEDADNEMLNLMAKHILTAVKGNFPRESLQVGKTRFNAKSINNPKELLQKIKRDLDRLFRLDEPITADDAYQFYLIDEVMKQD